MGLRFDLNTANWVAYFTEPDAPFPRLKEARFEKEALLHVLKNIKYEFYSSPNREQQFKTLVTKTENIIDSIENVYKRIPMDIFEEIRNFLTNYLWKALIIPAGRNREFDRFLCSKNLLRKILDIPSTVPGLILQLHEYEPINEIFSLINVFPAFRTALSEAINWPGILLWISHDDAIFLSLPERIEEVEESINWIFNYLADDTNINLELLLKRYQKRFPSLKKDTSSVIHILQLSDIHIGSKEARIRGPRIIQLIRNILSELGNDAIVIPIITGDLLESPTDDNIDYLRIFMENFYSLHIQEPVVIWGNHDVRNNGYLGENLKACLNIQSSSGRIIQYDNYRLFIICFNSVIEGTLARGFIGEPQFVEIGNQIDRIPNWQEYKKIVALHHHPTPVMRPDWYAENFFERIFGKYFERTEELADSEVLLDFVSHRSISAILHGHKHIPRFSKTVNNNIPILGCGSSVGKVKTKDGRIYISINLISLDNSRNRMVGRLLAERMLGGGLKPIGHELVYLNI